MYRLQWSGADDISIRTDINTISFARDFPGASVNFTDSRVNLRKLSKALSREYGSGYALVLECRNGLACASDDGRSTSSLSFELCDRLTAENAASAVNGMIELFEQENPRLPDERTLWDHNGSTVALIADGARRTFRFVKPRSGLSALGVERGELLFEGSVSGEEVVGDAFVFSLKCGPAKYAVKGSFKENGVLELKGAAPRRDANCKAVATRPDRLEFRYLLEQ